MTRAAASAKINLALVVGPLRDDGKHEVVTVLQRVDLCDRVLVERAPVLRIDGFVGDTIVRRALEALADAAGVAPRWRAHLTKEIPVAGGLGGGSSDAATALRLANATLPAPLPRARLHELARTLGSDVPFFLESGPQVAAGDGTVLAPVDLPQDYFVLLLLPYGVEKESTGAVYARFERHDGFATRARALRTALASVRRPRDLAALPPNDLASSPLADELRARGAFRADVSGAGPTVYALFHHRAAADAAAAAFRGRGRVWVTVPAWYG